MKEQVFPAAIDQLHPMMQWVRAHLVAGGCDQTTVRKIELALEEAIVNIVEHGYKRQPGTIGVRFQQKNSVAEIVLTDQGPPFNPLEQDVQFDPLAPLEERDLGGLGIFLYTQYMDEVHYKRENNSNVLTLRKTVTRSSQRT